MKVPPDYISDKSSDAEEEATSARISSSMVGDTAGDADYASQQQRNEEILCDDQNVGEAHVECTASNINNAERSNTLTYQDLIAQDTVEAASKSISVIDDAINFLDKRIHEKMQQHTMLQGSSPQSKERCNEGKYDNDIESSNVTQETFAEIMDRKIREGSYATPPMERGVNHAPEQVLESGPQNFPWLHNEQGGSIKGKVEQSPDILQGDGAPVPSQYLDENMVGTRGKSRTPTQRQRNAKQNHGAAAALEMPPPITVQPSTPAVPTFYEVEATLVQDSSPNYHQQPSIPVYDAVQVPEQQPEPWWK